MEDLNGQKMTLEITDLLKLELTFYVEDLRTRVPKLEADFDLVFHDAFSPQKMPELWTVDLFKEYNRLLSQRKGRVFTYSAAAAVRGGILEAGFLIGKTPALGVKQGGTIGCILGAGFSACGDSLSETEHAYLGTRAAIPYRDFELKQTRELILLQRQQKQETSALPSGSSFRQKL